MYYVAIMEPMFNLNKNLTKAQCFRFNELFELLMAHLENEYNKDKEKFLEPIIFMPNF